MGSQRNSGNEPRPDIICLEGNGARPSHRGIGFSSGGAMYTLNSVEVHCVCYDPEQLAYVYDARGNGGGYISPTLTGDHQNRITDYTAIVVEVVSVENYPSDSRIRMTEGTVQTLRERMGTGGGNVPLVMKINNEDTDREEIL